MSDEELERLLADLESDRVERKQSLSERDRIREAICTFANDLPNHRSPGVIFIGVTDDGRCAALPITDELLRTLADMRSDGNILPLPSITVQKRIVQGCELAVVTVEPSDAPPVQYRGRIWVRVGPRRAIATPEEERRLAEKRRSRDLPFDLHPVAPASLSDLDLELFERTYLRASVAQEILEQNQRSLEQQLTTLRMVSAGGTTPTVLGLLVLGKDPRTFIPCDYIQFLRLDGTELTDPITDAADIGGPLPDLLRMVEEKLQAHVETAREFASTPIDIAKPDYPIVALQQLTRNAVQHRTYDGTNSPVRISWFSDRIEILSPGGPYGQVNKYNFGQPDATDYRNPYLTEAMRNLGYVQRFGVGIALARRELEKNGNPPLEFKIEDTYVLAILRSHQ